MELIEGGVGLTFSFRPTGPTLAIVKQGVDHCQNTAVLTMGRGRIETELRISCP